MRALAESINRRDACRRWILIGSIGVNEMCVQFMCVGSECIQYVWDSTNGMHLKYVCVITLEGRWGNSDLPIILSALWCVQIVAYKLHINYTNTL